MTTNEVNILLRFQVDSIIKFYGSFIENCDIYIVMEYAERGSLSDYIKERQIVNAPFSTEVRNSSWIINISY